MSEGRKGGRNERQNVEVRRKDNLKGRKEVKKEKRQKEKEKSRRKKRRQKEWQKDKGRSKSSYHCVASFSAEAASSATTVLGRAVECTSKTHACRQRLT